MIGQVLMEYSIGGSLMSFMTWSDKYKLNLGIVDEQHENLFELVNQLYDSVVKGEEQNALGLILENLINYTVYHFETEEELFELFNYPKLEEHKKEHNDLANQVLDLQQRFLDHEITITYDILDFLNEWLKDHTTHSDMEFATFQQSSSSK
jgi:hemerythrin